MCFEQQSPVHKKNVPKTDPIWCSLSTVPNQRKIFLLKQWLDTQQYLTCLNSLMPTAYCAPIQERVLFIHDHFPVHKAKCKIGWMIIFYFVFCNQGIWIFLKMFGPKCWRNLNPWKLTMWLLFSNCVIDLSTDISHNQDYLVFFNTDTLRSELIYIRTEKQELLGGFARCTILASRTFSIRI